MTTKKVITQKKSPVKSSIQTETAALLSTSLISLKQLIGEKKFEKRIKKAAKLLTHGVKPAAVKKATVKKGSTKKLAPKKAAKKNAIPTPVAKPIKVSEKK